MDQQPIKHVVDAAAATGAGVAVLGWLQPTIAILQPATAILASAAAFVWYVMQMYGAWKRRKK